MARMVKDERQPMATSSDASAATMKSWPIALPDTAMLVARPRRSMNHWLTMTTTGAMDVPELPRA